MSTVIIEQEFVRSLTADDIVRPDERTLKCMQINRAFPRRHYLARGGMQCVCVFDAPDAEAIRSAFRTAGSYTPKGIWAATIHQSPDDEDASGPPALQHAASALALVKRSFGAPVAFDDVQAMEDAGTDCLNLHRVRFLRSYFSTDRKRMICLYEAPDVEAVRNANRQVGLPFEEIWGAEVIGY